MLKYQLDSLEGLTDEQKALYEEKDGKYVLKVEGLPDPGTGNDDLDGLKRKVDELLSEKKESQRRAKEAEEEAKRAKEEKAKKDGDYKTLAEQYETKINELKEQLDNQAKEVGQREVQRQAMELAGELSEGANQKILARFIEDRLRYEEGAVKVTDNDGNLTISTLDDLKKEFAGSDQFASLVVASRASGGGASGNSGGGAAGKKLSDMTDEERVQLYRENPDEYRRLRDAEQTKEE